MTSCVDKYVIGEGYKMCISCIEYYKEKQLCINKFSSHFCHLIAADHPVCEEFRGICEEFRRKGK